MTVELRIVGRAWRILKKLRLRPTSAPTVTKYLPKVRDAATPAALRTYEPYWKKAELYFGRRKLHKISPSDILALKQWVIANSKTRKGHRGGRYAGEDALLAMRYLYQLAVKDGLVKKANNPASKVKLARRLRSTRHGLSAAEITDINSAMLMTSRDRELDGLILRLHIESGCRRAGALGLRICDLDLRYSRVLLREKFGSQRWQPISPTLSHALLKHTRSRGGNLPEDALLRYANGSALTSRHYDALWSGIRSVLPWAAQLGVSAHWLRHTTLTWVERRFGYAIARAYAGHEDDKRGVTLTYLKGMPREVADVLVALTNEDHPLALKTTDQLASLVAA